MISRRSFKSIDILSVSPPDSMPGSPGKSSSSALSPSNNASSLSLGSDRKFVRLTGLWRWLSLLLLVGITMYIVTHDNETESSERIVRGGHPEKRELTIVLNTFKRYDLMNKAINYYSKCDCVKYIYIIWSEELPPSQSMLSRFSDTDIPRVIFNIQKEDSLNNRFKPLPEPHTDAVFSVDDDMRIPCDELALALEVWRSAPRSMVGFMPRIHLRGQDGLLKYRCWWKVWWTGAYSIILTKASILHHDFFHAYFEQMPRAVFDLVDKRRNCEDIAMQFLMSNITSLPPIYVKGHLGDKGALGGISTKHNVIKAGHMIQRDDCLNELVKIYGHNPLKRSHFFVDANSNRFNSAPSTWWEYISSDLWKWE